MTADREGMRRSTRCHGQRILVFLVAFTAVLILMIGQAGAATHLLAGKSSGDTPMKHENGSVANALIAAGGVVIGALMGYFGARAAASAQIKMTEKQIASQEAARAKQRKEQLLDGRRARTERTILALQDAMNRLAQAVGAMAEDRRTASTQGGWTTPPATIQALDLAFLDAYRLAQRLPLRWPGWAEVDFAIDAQREAVVAADDPGAQELALTSFRAGIQAAHHALGNLLNELDDDLMSGLAEG